MLIDDNCLARRQTWQQRAKRSGRKAHVALYFKQVFA
jgi:hypothetical protein